MRQYRILTKDECRMDHPFWNRYINLVRDQVIPYQWEILNDRIPDSEPSHAIDNYRIAAGELTGNFYGEVFQDSDVAKWLEAVGNILLLERDEDLEAKADQVIDIIAAAQEADGYLDTYFTIEAPDKKWSNLLECHELYCAGHFIEGAVAYYRGTGKEKVLQIAIRLADYICGVFGPEKGKIHGYPGHQEIEIALIRLYDLTGNEEYFSLAQYFIDARGTSDFFEQEFEKRDRTCFWTKAEVKEPNRWYNQFSYKNYNQFHLPVRQQKEATGHAVRAVYMYTAMADIAARTGEKELFDACRALWEDITTRQMYITGGIGSTHSGEAFTIAYDLPNDTNYSETCASIGLMFFAQKMLKSEVHRTYGDVLEQALYNTVLGGMNYEGNRFFYVNPLEVVPETCYGNTERNHVKPVRQKWFSCACCPPNIARTIPDLWEYIYTTREDTAYVHLFIGSEAVIQMKGGKLKVKQTTDYPFDNRIHFDVKSEQNQNTILAVRIPEWSETFALYIDGEALTVEPAADGYIYLERNFYNGMKIELALDMTPRFIQANQNVHYNAGRIAVTRGPLVYCIEEVDNGKYLNQISFDLTEPLTEKRTDLFDGCVIIEGKGFRRHVNAESGRLYQPCDMTEEAITIKAVPYFLWNNREPGEMQVWVRAK